jgi:hypothetical protein
MMLREIAQAMRDWRSTLLHARQSQSDETNNPLRMR